MIGSELSYGRMVRERRRALDLTQEELARRVGCAAITIRKIEAGDMRTSQQVAERLVAALGVPLDERTAFVRGLRRARPSQKEPPSSPRTPILVPAEIGAADLSGHTIRGYALGERIGSGGFGAVYRAEQPLIERAVAIKIILPQYADHPDFIRRFEAEAQLVARLEHPYIVPLYDYWREPGVAYLVMRLLRGGSLHELLQQGPLPLPLTLRVVDQVGAALHAAHRAGVVHRDLKPANILLDADQNAYLADFGIAKDLGGAAEKSAFGGAYVGSPAYSSPEQIRAEPVTPQSDIYALGILLYELLTGQKPFVGPTPVAYIQQHLNTAMPPLIERRSGLPDALDRTIQRATAKVPSARFASVAELVAEVRAAIGERPVTRQVGLTQPPVAAPPTAVLDLEDADNPYKGLRPFDEADAAAFFGREGLIQQLLSRMGESGELTRFLAVIGPSGSGKSSVVRAGLIPALRSGGLPGSEQWYAIDLLPGGQPLEALAAAICRVAPSGVEPEDLHALLRADNRGLLRAARLALPSDPATELLIVIDQFEELFTLTTDPAVRAHLLDSIVTAVLDERSRVRVVITLRADFVDRPLQYVDFGELVQQRSELVLPLTPDEIERAVVGPARRAGLALEEGLVAALVAEVGAQPGGLPLLQHTLSELFARRQGRILTRAAYAAIGGVAGSLARSAEAIYDTLDQAAQAAARQLFLRLVVPGEGGEDTRRRVLKSELTALTTDDQRTTNDQIDARPSSSVLHPSSAMDEAIDRYGRARLLTFDHDPASREPTVEVAHEALLREWPRLGEWLAASRERLLVQRRMMFSAAEWQHSGRENSFLASGTRLAQFADLAENTDGGAVALTGDEQAYVAASLAEQQRALAAEHQQQARELALQQRAASRLRYLVAGLALFLVVAGGLAAWALNRSQLAQANFAHADALRLAAEANSQWLTHGDNNLIALLSLRSLQIEYSPAGDAALVVASMLDYAPREIVGGMGELESVKLSPDGKYVAATAGDVKGAALWDVATGKLLRTFSGHTDGVIRLAFSPDGKELVTGSFDTTARLWDVATGQTIRIFSGHRNWITGIDFSPDGRSIATSSLDGTARIWDRATGTELRRIAVISGTADVAFSPDSKYLLTSAGDEMVRLWDVASGQQIRVFSGPTDIELALMFSPDGKYVAGGGEKTHTVRVWEAASGQLVHTLTGHEASLRRLAFSPDGRYLLSAGDDHTARLWDVASGQLIHTFAGHTNAVTGVAFTPNGHSIVTSSFDGTVRIWPLQLTKGSLQFIGHTSGVWEVSFSPDGKRVLTASADNTARIWDATSGQELLRFGRDERELGEAAISRELYGAAFSPDGRAVLTVGDKNAARLWDTATGQELLRFAGHTAPIRQAAFSPDGKRAVTASDDGTARVWDAASGQELLRFAGHTGPVTSVAFAPDGSAVVTGGGDMTARIWNPVTGKEAVVLTGHTAGVSDVAFSPDSKWVATTSGDSSVRLWDAATGKEVRQFLGHSGFVSSAAFSPDGAYLLTGGSFDRTARVWNVQTGVEVRRLTTQSTITDVSFSPDGTHFLTGAGEVTASLWPTDYHDTIRYLCGVLTRDMTPEERSQYGIAGDGPTCQ
jgi:WD40 repeat protein/serine/threonine protein kinase/DNA-binding XRE family transcriptional regulator